MRDFEQLWREYQYPLELWLYGLCGDRSLAEELASETMLRALMSIGSFRGESGIFTWLCAIARNLLVSEQRRQARHTPLEPEHEPSDASDVAEEVSDRDAARRISAELERLGEPYREVFALHALGGVPLAEVSRRFGKSESWARVTYYRAKKEITERMQSNGQKL